MQPTNHSTKNLKVESCQIVIRRPLLEQTNLHTKHTPGIRNGTLNTVTGDMLTSLFFWLKALKCSG